MKDFIVDCIVLNIRSRMLLETIKVHLGELFSQIQQKKYFLIKHRIVVLFQLFMYFKKCILIQLQYKM